MITSPLLYLFVIGMLAFIFATLASKTNSKIFNYLPAVVIIYACSMALASLDLFASNEAITHTYKTAKNNLLPAMLFLMLINVDFKLFKQLGRKLTIAYFSAVVSLAFSFVLVFVIFQFSANESGTFGALAGSWMGGTANMLAVGAALNVSEAQMGVALVIDSVDYALWVMFLLTLVPLAPWFNEKMKTSAQYSNFNEIGCACNLGPKSYYFLLISSLLVALVSQLLAEYMPYLSYTTWLVIFATIFGIIGSFSPLKKRNGSQQIASSMLYLLVALIGSRADFAGMNNILTLLFAGILILILHAAFLVLSAKLFKLDLFSIALASLANIGGVASAPILAAAYHRSLIGIAVIMAIFGYLIGTFGGLAVGYLLKVIAQ